jgi:hypothetical protein
MNDFEVHSLILNRVNHLEDDEIRSFLRDVLEHERDIVQEPRGEYAEHYRELVDKYVGNKSLGEYSDE